MTETAETAVGEEMQLKVTDELTGEDFSDKVLWSSQEEEIVTVSDTGKITGIKEGNTKVYAWFEDEILQCEVTVTENADSFEDPASEEPITENPIQKDPSAVTQTSPGTMNKVQSLKISGISKKLAAGKKVQLSACITPDTAVDKTLTWASSNTKYATVDSKGRVTLKKKGAGKKVTITATTKDGTNIKAVYKITIMKDAVKSIKLDKPPKSVVAGKSVKLKAIVKTTGKKANKTLKWTSTNTQYAMVSKNGVVKTKKAGKGKTVKITVMSTDGSNKKASVKLKIK